jgi:hypothetical protein
MANKTTQDLVTRVLQKLITLQPGEDPSAEDDAFVTDAWSTINANLRKLKLSYWPDNFIPDEVFEPLANYLKEYLWEEYKGPRDNNAAIVEQARVPLIAAVGMPYVGSVQAAEDY